MNIALANEMVSDFVGAKDPLRVFDSSNTLVYTTKSLYRVVVKRRKDGKSAGKQDIVIHLDKSLHKRIGKSVLRSVPEIMRTFA